MITSIAVASPSGCESLSSWNAKLMSRLSRYRYFSYRIVWTNDAMELARSCPAWVGEQNTRLHRLLAQSLSGAAGPHGVMPFANVLSIPAINSFVSEDETEVLVIESQSGRQKVQGGNCECS